MLIPISRDVINRFREWNSHALRNDLFYDKMMVRILLINCVGSDNIRNGMISEKVKKFIQGNFVE